MIRVERPELSDDPDWLAWQRKARDSMATLVAEHQTGAGVTINDSLYKQAMPFLLRLFNGKCAYCEAVIAADQPGDVEHYRPKAGLRDEHGQVVKVNEDGVEREHPGYWWLAYEWTNLLPSCIDCNRLRRHGLARNAAGKGERFAVRGPRASRPTDKLDDEGALLLDPSNPAFDAAQHFEFLEDGKIKPKTPEAEYSCELLGLNLRESLPALRELAFLQAQQALTDFLVKASLAPNGRLALTRRQINDMWEGRSPYSAFARRALEQFSELWKTNTGQPLKFPLPR